MLRIFISYRRSDSPYVSDILKDALKRQFGDDSVFRDIEDIPLGADFRETITDAVGQCDVLLAIIGDEWVNATDAQGLRKIDAPGDWVRTEIEAALRREIPVVPVLVDRALIPSPNDLPESIRNIAYRNAAEIRPGLNFHSQLNHLLKGLQRLGEQKAVADQKAKTIAAPPKNPVNSRQPVRKQKSDSQKKAGASPENLTGKEKSPMALKRAQALEVIRSLLGEFASESLFTADNLPHDKLANAFESYAPDVSVFEVLLLFDNSVFGGAKHGLILTANAVYWCNNNMAQAKKRLFSEIQIVEYSSGFLWDGVMIDGAEIQVTKERPQLTQILADIILNLTRI